MQIINALVAIGGDRNNMLWKEGISPPEILLLQSLHGADAVSSIEPAQEVERDPWAEIERLRALYPGHHARIQDIWRDYPGDRFPTKLAHLNLTPALLKAAEASKPFNVSAKPAAA